MEDKELRETIETLHSNLEKTPSVNDDSRELLRELLEDIAELLERSGVESPVKEGCAGEPPDRMESLVERLKEATLHFEVDHPHLAKAIDRVVDALGRGGI
jgi:hypothetical protein